MSRMGKIAAVCALALGAALGGSSAALADVSVTYSGQGTVATGSGPALETEECGTDGEGYLLWVFTATKGTTATITGPWGTALMSQSGNGTFKYVSGYYDLEDLIGSVSAWSDQMGGNPQLVISHGCEGGYGYPSYPYGS